eukprot:scaffold49026_cov29-Tisochrysis_lutea.AAC.4
MTSREEKRPNQLYSVCQAGYARSAPVLSGPSDRTMAETPEDARYAAAAEPPAPAPTTTKSVEAEHCSGGDGGVVGGGRRGGDEGGTVPRGGLGDGDATDRIALAVGWRRPHYGRAGCTERGAETAWTRCNRVACATKLAPGRRVEPPSRRRWQFPRAITIGDCRAWRGDLCVPAGSHPVVPLTLAHQKATLPIRTGRGDPVGWVAHTSRSS